jgi:hypothetical protein
MDKRKIGEFKEDVNNFAKDLNSSFIGVVGLPIRKIVCKPFIKKTEEGAYIEHGCVTIKVKWEGNARRAMVKIFVYYLRVALLPCIRGRVSQSLLLCIIYVVAEGYFSDMPDALDFLYERFLNPYLKKNPTRKNLYATLQVLREKGLLLFLLSELRYTKNRIQLFGLLDCFYNVATKKRGKDIKNLFKNQFVVIMLGRCRIKFQILRYQRFVSACIEKKNIKRVYLVATSRKELPINVALAKALDLLLQRDEKLKKLRGETFERKDTDVPMESFVAAYEVV